jgi:EAL domain-containing protein (putative c-di-GMP-specific phosphodiesterase class I)
MATTIAISGMQVAVNISIGIAVAGLPTGDVVTEAEQLVADAQLAMRAAKSQVRSRFQVFDSQAKERAGKRVELEMELGAIDAQQMFVMFQPITIPVSGGVVGVEALLRWRHPRRGVLDTNEFLLAAEDTGLIVPMGTYALDTATAQLRIWDDEGVTSSPQWISVNLSRRQIARTNLIEVVSASLDRCGLRPERLCLEVSERVINSLGATTERVLNQFADLGVNLAVDDVGTVPTNLELLGRFPLRYLKIDPVLLQHIDIDVDRRRVVTGVIAFAHSLDCRVVAEGVEDASVLDVLADLGCDAVQGYAVAPPLEADTVAAFLVGRGGR